jgi:predicted PolB exonuclease-like 3'-5' exonuclease
MSVAVFDIETRIDKRLLNQVLFRGRDLDDEGAYDEFRRAASDERGRDFAPLAFHVPVSVAVASVNAEHGLEAIETLAGDSSGEESLVREFWTRVEEFRGRWVSFYGRNFDLPVMELAALRYGCPAPSYFAGWRDAPDDDKHYDLYDFLTRGGSYRLRGGLDVLLRMIGHPGKGRVEGSRVQELWDGGRLDEIHRYCRRDVLLTYVLFLRIELIRGRLSVERYRDLLESTSAFADVGEDAHALGYLAR